MKIIRYLDSLQQTQFGRQNEDGSAERLSGELYQKLTPTGETADVRKLLAPLMPSAILCIGLNYKQHAAESGMQAPAEADPLRQGNQRARRTRAIRL